MPEATRDLMLLPSPAVRRLTWILVAVGVAVAGLYGSMALLGHFPMLLPSTILVVAILAGRPLMTLGGRTILDADGITVRRPPGRTVTVPYDQVIWVEVRRGPLREGVVLHRRHGVPVRLRAPVRLWFRDAPSFDRELAEICSRTGLPACAERFHLGVVRQFAACLLLAAALTLVLIDPPWKSDAWPFRPHARALPDTCRIFDARAQRLIPGAQVDRGYSVKDEHVERHTCRWRSGHPTNRISSLSIEYELDHGIGPMSDADEAHHTFRDDTRAKAGEEELRLTGTGDEARMILAEHSGGRFAAVTVAARRANVEEKIEFILRDGHTEARAMAMANELARSGLSKIRFR